MRECVCSCLAAGELLWRWSCRTSLSGAHQLVGERVRGTPIQQIAQKFEFAETTVIQKLKIFRAYQKAQNRGGHSPKRVPSGRTQSPSKPRSPPSASDKTTHSAPYEEIVHIKERYERDETIRRFFPTTTTV
ncbi:unnamed protein product [Caenorhabditis nigoni]